MTAPISSSRDPSRDPSPDPLPDGASAAAAAATAPPPLLSDVVGKRYTGSPRQGRAFLALLSRDIFVTGKELVAFLAQVLLQPLFLLFIFGKVLGDLGYTQGNYAEVLFPGIVALTAFLTALQNTAFPLVIDFAYTKEIEDRLLAPLPTSLVAAEKILYSTLRALVAAGLMFPLGWWMLGTLPMTAADILPVIGYLILGSLVGAAAGLTLGTLVTPAKMNLVFSVVLAPLMFLGATQFPLLSLDHLRWFQILCSINPLTYLSEGLRAQMLDGVPGVPHLAQWISTLALVGFLIVFTWIGNWGFRRRALD